MEEKEREGEIEKLISGEWCLSVKRLSAECRGASWLRLVWRKVGFVLFTLINVD